MNPTVNYWAVVPAAGVGRRVGGDVPKQFLALGNKTVLEHSLESLWHGIKLKGLVLVSAGHPALASIQERFSSYRLLRAAGGIERCHSVLNGLDALSGKAHADDWVLVHDAARPCVRQQDLHRLLDYVSSHPVGGLLGFPVHDTLKRADARRLVYATVDRTGLWHAHTPQMFRYGLLHEALMQALADGYHVTDEASAMEHAGYQPMLVEGHADNIKITHPDDLLLAEYFLRQQGRL
jgi:2-C-methyl-D-erythritol 4-phosphate cytidylyltransferase